MERVNVGGYSTVRASRTELAHEIAEQCRKARNAAEPPRPWLVFSSNGQGIALAGANPDFDTAMDAAEVIHADGMSVVIASRILTRRPIVERSATTDLFHDVAKVAQQQGLRFFILGGSEDMNARAVAQMQELYPNLKIVGRQHGYFGRDQDAEICAQIVKAQTDVLWVGLGKPLQEIWSHRNRDALRGVGCIKTCGGLYAFLTGDAPRAPLWMQKVGLEWAYRFAQEPRRLFKRYLITNALSAWRLLTRT